MGHAQTVAAFLLARGDAVDRPQAERDAGAYYAQLPEDMAPNDKLDPRRIREWVARRIGGDLFVREPETLTVAALLVRDANAYINPQCDVMQYSANGGLLSF